MNFLKIAVGASLIVASLASTAFADATTSPLAAGKPAGVHQAQMMEGNNLLLAIGIGGIVAAAVVLATDNGSNNQIASTTTGTTP